MRNENSIFKRTTCGICGEVEYKPYIGRAVFDGGYTTSASFEKTEYKFCNIGGGEHSFYACPKCYKKIEDCIDNLKKQIQFIRNGEKEYE